jgi:hypothetical protein
VRLGRWRHDLGGGTAIVVTTDDGNAATFINNTTEYDTVNTVHIQAQKDVNLFDALDVATVGFCYID